MLRLLFLVLLFPSLSQAEIFKCTENGRTVYSDTACGDEAEIINIEEATKPTGLRFSTENLESLGNKMYKERRTAELKRDISDQEDSIEDIIDDYTNTTEKLNEELAEHKRSIDTSKWSKHAYKKKQYYERKRHLMDEIKEARRKYKASKEKAYNKLYSLKQKQRDLRFEK